MEKGIKKIKYEFAFTLIRTRLRRNLDNVKGFTLIELLIVIAILGILSVIVLIAVDPGERQAQARDTGRLNTVTQIGHSIQSYYSARQGNYPQTATWAQDLLSGGDLASFPDGLSYSSGSATNCTTFVQPGVDPTYCYDLDATNGALVFTVAESNSHRSKCIAPEEAYFVFSTADGRAGTICNSGDPSPWTSGTQVYVD